MSCTLFISDLHLDPERPEITGLFLDYLAQQAGRADALYILGDLFEAWIGDDDDSELATTVSGAIRQCAYRGTPVSILHGNRDFLLGDAFAGAAHCRLLPDPAIIDLYGTPTLLMHGDLLCTGDTEYQKFRAQVHDPAWQAALLEKPLAERRAIAQQLRAESRARTAGKPESIMDVDPQAVIDIMSKHHVLRLIHGHTHRPAIHELTVHGSPAQRMVLGDWYGHGSVLRCTAQGCRLQVIAPGPAGS
jgi:UDP-2,3-diacylglucosamine hydrolase